MSKSTDKIALFGDSYLDRYHGHPVGIDYADVPQNQKIWIQRLAEETNMSLVNNGRSGSPLYYAVDQWKILQSRQVDFQYAVWALTWHHRLYVHPSTDYPTINQPNLVLESLSEHDPVSAAAYLYKKHLYCDEYLRFIHELMIKWVMELPKSHPTIKFIFIANNSFSLELAKKYFIQGILLDLSFEEISALEGEDVTHGPWPHEKFGHLTDLNHERFKNFVRPLFLNYDSYRDCIVPVDISQFSV